MAGGQFANVIKEDRLLQRVELGDIGCDLGEEGIGREHRCLVAMAGVGVTQKGGYIHLERTCQAIERREGRHSLAVLDLRDVGTGHAHAPGKLTLREIAHLAKLANGVGDLQTAFFFLRGRDYGKWRRLGLWKFNLQAFVAAAAQCVGCAELHEAAVVATEHLPLFYRRHHGCHKLCRAERVQSKDRSTCPITERCDVPRVTPGIAGVKGNCRRLPKKPEESRRWNLQS